MSTEISVLSTTTSIRTWKISYCFSILILRLRSLLYLWVQSNDEHIKIQTLCISSTACVFVCNFHMHIQIFTCLCILLYAYANYYIHRLLATRHYDLKSICIICNVNPNDNLWDLTKEANKEKDLREAAI